MPKRKAIIAVLLAAALLGAALAVCVSRDRKPARYIHDEALLGASKEDLAKEWAPITPDPGSVWTSWNIGYRYTRWDSGNKLLIAVFREGRVADYALYDAESGALRSPTLPSMSTGEILDAIRAGQVPEGTYDIGSGVSIYSRLSNDGRIVVWTETKETHIFSITDARETREYFVFRLLNGMLI